jgi:hypothetical protein
MKAAATRREAARPLRTSILIGSIYDWVLAILILASPAALLALLRIPPPVDPFHYRFSALLLLVVPFFYLLAWKDPDRYSGVIGAMVITRVAGFLYVTIYGAARGAPTAYALFGLADLGFALTHLALARRAGYAREDLFAIPSLR